MWGRKNLPVEIFQQKNLEIFPQDPIQKYNPH
jgi:hypothetical protein